MCTSVFKQQIKVIIFKIFKIYGQTGEVFNIILQKCWVAKPTKFVMFVRIIQHFKWRTGTTLAFCKIA